MTWLGGAPGENGGRWRGGTYSCPFVEGPGGVNKQINSTPLFIFALLVLWEARVMMTWSASLDSSGLH